MISRRYARALFEAAWEMHDKDDVYHDIQEELIHIEEMLPTIHMRFGDAAYFRILKKIRKIKEQLP